MAESGSEKKHAPTERRRQQAREEGRVARSGDLSSAVLLLAALASLWLLGGHAAEHLAGAITDGLSEVTVTDFSADDANYTLLRGGGRLAIAVVPMLIAMMVIGVLVNISQTGFLLLPNKLAPSMQNISPATGIKRIWSVAGFARFGFGMLKVLIVAGVAYAAVLHYGDQILNLPGLQIPQIARTLFDCLLGICVWIGGSLFVLAVIDYGFQRWKHERELMMTDEELREELRETEGDPAVASRRKQIQQARPTRIPASSSDRTGQGSHPAAAADLVITDGSDIAVALRYNPRTMAAPVVVAKGNGVEGETIRRVVRERQVPTFAQPLLAQYQFRSVNVGQEIPSTQYVSVANLLRQGR
ncbi:EscU/YscU/HrcU family type III secretion system export apparatus switch protein [Planctomycetes bacterium K23_9]|uniref:Flagellar biosynthetic protein FlhB n=1 Tax=Stieleria marina TaxID=1930275 RepID=A0A517NPD1_9BACT|nr:Flagellar biosynthetic protein FlhB [Planctomycetes bacterium K23_9]